MKTITDYLYGFFNPEPGWLMQTSMLGIEMTVLAINMIYEGRY